MRQHQAFTLIEIILVTALIGVLMSVSLPGLMRLAERSGTARKLDRIEAALHQARVLAIEKSIDVQVEFDGSHWTISKVSNAWPSFHANSATPNSFGSGKWSDDGFRIQVLRSRASNEVVTFAADGTSQDAQIVLSRANQVYGKIHIDGTLGKIWQP